MMSETLVGTPVAACMVVEPTRSAAKKMATRMVARGWSCAMRAMATPSKP